MVFLFSVCVVKKKKQKQIFVTSCSLCSYRFDVAVQEAHGVDRLDGLQDLLPEPQGGAHGEGSSGLTPPQVGQVTALWRLHGRKSTSECSFTFFKNHGFDQITLKPY